MRSNAKALSKELTTKIIRELNFATNFSYNVSMKVLEDTKVQLIDLLMKESKGIIQVSQFLNLGVSKPLLYSYIKENNLKRVSHGIYVTQESWIDYMYILHLRCKQAIFSHETALFMHNITNREPLQYTITVKTGYNPKYLKEDGFLVHTIKEELFDVGAIRMNTPYNHVVPAYNKERTICDILRNRRSTDIQVLQDALKQYASRRDKDLRTLMKYATIFKVEKILRPYLEVLL